MALKALALNCTLKADNAEESSTDAMISVLAKAFNQHDVRVSETVRVAALDIKAGVTSDEGNGDAWPVLIPRQAAPSFRNDAAPLFRRIVAP